MMRAPIARASSVAAQPDWPLPEDRQRVPPGDIEPLQRHIGGARAAGNRGSFVETECVGQADERAGGHAHVRGIAAIAGEAIDDAAVQAHLAVALPAMMAFAAAVIMMHHHAVADPRLGVRDVRAPLDDNAARLVPADWQPLRVNIRLWRAIRAEIAAAQARTLDADNHIIRPRRRVRKLPQFHLTIPQKDESAHLHPPRF